MTWRRRLGLGGLALAALWACVAMLPPPVSPTHPFFAGHGDRVLVIAHRGGRGLGPESTLERFRHAVELGVDVLEFDVRPTADGVLVALHDRTVDRTTDGSGPVSEMPLEAVKALDAGYQWSPPDAPDRHPHRGQGRRIPTLEEILTAFPQMPMVIELKRPDAADAAELCAALDAHDRRPRTVVASFHDEALAHFRAACPGVATSASSGEVRGYLIWHLLRLDVLARPAFQAFEVPESVGPLTLVDRRFVKTARARNLPVEVWTVNDEESMERLIDLGVDGIMTDRPDRLLDLLQRRGLR